MKKLVFVLFVCMCTLSYAQQEKVTRTHYYFMVSNVNDENLLQQIIDEVNTYKAVQGCKYRIKPEKNMAEISFVFDEKPNKGEGDKGDPLPNLKQLITDKGLTYSGFTSNTETVTK